MTDIVERLAMLAVFNPPSAISAAMEEAADEITRLRLELKEWREEPFGGLVRAGVLFLSPERVEAAKAQARREGIEAAAREVDCSCEVRDAVLARLEARDLTRASWLCQHGDVCCALQAAEILDLLKDER